MDPSSSQGTGLAAQWPFEWDYEVHFRRWGDSYRVWGESALWSLVVSAPFFAALLSYAGLPVIFYSSHRSSRSLESQRDRPSHRSHCLSLLCRVILKPLMRRSPQGRSCWFIFPGCRQPSQQKRKMLLISLHRSAQNTFIIRWFWTRTLAVLPCYLSSQVGAEGKWKWKQQRWVPFRVPAWQQERDSEVRMLVSLLWDGLWLVNSH